MSSRVVLFAMIAVLTAAAVADAVDPSAGAGIGMELQASERNIAGTVTVPETTTPVPPAPPAPDATQETTGELPPGTYRITKLELQGDAALLETLGLLARLEQDTVGKALNAKDALDIATYYQSLCVNQGYYLCGITVASADRSKGVLVLNVDAGRVGRMSFYSAGESPATDRESKVPFKGRHFSAGQLVRELRALDEGKPFNYNLFYRSVFAINAHPDLEMDSDLKLRKELVDGRQTRYADMDFYVREKQPLHGIAEIKNTGTESTEEWRGIFTIQHLNMTLHNDILTLNLISSPDLGALLSVAASYVRPYYLANGGNLTLYGGYSEVEARDIVPMIDLSGDGWFAGVQASYNLVATEKHQLTIAGGAVSRFIQSGFVMTECAGEDEITTQERKEVEIMPVSVALSYSSAKPDAWGGRNFLTSVSSFNIGGSDDKELAEQRANAKTDYFVERILAARIQPVFGRQTATGRQRQWLLFLKLDAQYASEPLVPLEQKAVGGMDTVRGYVERDAMGDNGISGTLELRTPLFSRLIGRGLAAGEAVDHLQFLVFLDGAYVNLNEPLESDEESRTLLGAGFGLRLAYTQHAQFRLDWGLPLEDSESSDSGGRMHIGLQAQF